MSSGEEKFYTVRGYELMQHEACFMTPSMEDYLEMICRLGADKGYTRISDLAQALNVQPPSATAMVQKLSEMGYLQYQKYGIIELTEKGKRLGSYLLSRHQVIEEFLSLIGVTDGLLAETEKIEHNLSPHTVQRLCRLVSFLRQNNDWKTQVGQGDRFRDH